MARPLVVSLVALLIVVVAALATAIVLPESVRLPALFFGLSPVLAAGLLVARHRNAHGFLVVTVITWASIGVLALLDIVLLGGNYPIPTWAVARVALGSIAGVASVVALVAGTRFLRTAA